MARQQRSKESQPLERAPNWSTCEVFGLQLVIHPPIPDPAGFVLLLQLLFLHTLCFPHLVPLAHFPALPYDSKTGGNLFMVQTFRRYTQAFGQALRGFPFL